MSTRRRTVLVIDDDATVRVLMRTALRGAGFEVVLGDSGHDALRLFGSRDIDLVMLDVGLPDTSGFEVCKALRERAGGLLPIVMVTGKDDVDSVEKAYESGATDFIAKPLNWPLLAHRVRYVLRAQDALLDLKSAHARNTAILSAIPDSLLHVDRRGQVLQVRPGLTGGPLPPLPAVGATLYAGLTAEGACGLERALELAFASGGVQDAAFASAGADGRRHHCEARIAVVGTDEALVVLRDITARMEAEQQITRLAYTDSLTGLANREHFLGQLEAAVARAREQEICLAVLFMDLDGFKQVNDTYGHAVGDQVLRTAADRLRGTVRSSDLVARAEGGVPGAMHLARLGGDEFTALLTGLADPADAQIVADRIAERIREPFVLGHIRLELAASIGVALYPGDASDAAGLLGAADAAMYRRKLGRRAIVQVDAAPIESVGC